MTGYTYFTATTLDGFIADEHDSLEWLFEQQHDGDGPGGYDAFIAGIGAAACGSTTYAWVRDHLAESGEPWPYDIPFFVFTHRALEPLHPEVRFVSGRPGEHRAALEQAAGGRDVWVVGGGDLAGQFADDGMLDRLRLSVASATLGVGRPLLPRRLRLTLTDVERNGELAVLGYDVRGPLDGPTLDP